MTSRSYFAGIDWASRAHAVCVIDACGKVVLRLDIAHSQEGIERLIRQLKSFKDLAVAIERPSGVLVDALIEAGITVVPVHPNVLKASRPRYQGRGKTDPADAYMLADILRTDGHRFRPLDPQTDEIRALRALVRTRDDLVAERVALANQLRSLLESCWPGAVEIFAAIDSPIALAFIDRYPTPHSASRLGEKRLAAFLAQHSYCGRRPVAALLERLHSAPDGCIGELEAEAKGELARSLASILERLVAELAKLSARIEHTVSNLADGQIVMSFPRSGRICAAQILSELGAVRERFPSEAQLAAEAGVAPVTFKSGKQHSVTFRWACNHRLRRALTCFADQSRHANAWAAHVYQRARARGCDHPHAIRVLARAWVRVLWRAWFTRTPYQPHLHRSAAALQPAMG
ncbi:MAG: IS110 family transposase [Panacagrimonas sp.]